MRSLKSVLVVTAVIVAAFLAGCANNMALTKGKTGIDPAGKAIVLVPVTVSNQNKSGYQPDLTAAFMTSGGDNIRFNTKDGLDKEEKDKFKEYLLSFDLAPGTYTLERIAGAYKIPLLIKAWCSIPLNAPFEVKANTITYLGHVDATIVERMDDSQERAGGLIPLLDQSIAGFSTGTFVVGVSDRYDEDIAKYTAEYPGLKGLTIIRTILPQKVQPVATAK
jgi:hypothetical protein